jgi:hypothetical protein
MCVNVEDSYIPQPLFLVTCIKMFSKSYVFTSCSKLLNIIKNAHGPLNVYLIHNILYGGSNKIHILMVFPNFNFLCSLHFSQIN